MDKNGYFFYVTSTAKKKKISLMHPKPPRVAFEEKRRPGTVERVSVVQNTVQYGREMSRQEAPRARLYTQLESYQPRYHTIRDSDKIRDRSDECKKKRNSRTGYQMR